MLAALAAIVRDMRDVPRDCIRDPAELVTWLRRMAGRVEGVGRMRVPAQIASRPLNTYARSVNAPRPLNEAEVVFGKGPAVARLSGPRTIVSRRGRAVRVEVRRARASEQMELEL